MQLLERTFNTCREVERSGRTANRVAIHETVLAAGRVTTPKTLLVDCPDCDGEGEVLQDCSVCAFKYIGGRDCNTCGNSGKVAAACNGCGGAGRIPMYKSEVNKNAAIPAIKGDSDE